VNDPSARRRSEKTSGRRRFEISRDDGRPAPRLVLEIALESQAKPTIVASSHEDELRLRGWLRQALDRRESLSKGLERWLDVLDARDAA
jgi:hypothetical protein